MNWKAGMKAVCVDGRWVHSITREWSSGPKEGDVVTVSDTEPCKSVPGQVQLFLEEWPGDRSYYAPSFRPLLEDLTASLAETEAGRLVEERPEVVREPQPLRA